MAKPTIEDISLALGTLSTDQHDRNGPLNPANVASGDSIGDDQSQLSSSSLKQQSFDTKSMASVTTFALDEKESIRPDDSASVRAADEDEPHPGLSRNSSFQQEAEPAIQKINPKITGPSVTIAARRYPYTTLVNPPRFGDLPLEPLPEPQILEPTVDNAPANALVEENRARLSETSTGPDEKLLEALSSHKDRLPLLQLEEKIVAFIAAGRDTMLELPPQNSFTRLLTHKLADYYNLAHHINDDNSSVRIFRTDCFILPLSLAEIARSIPLGSQQMSHATQVKIMRRAQLGSRQFSTGNSTAASSSVPSKATSENGAETNSEEGLQSPSEGTPSRDRSKLTREEREAQYKAARERIFGDFQESVASESGSTGEASVSMSRSSSSSGKKKARKNRVPKDDTFEARSAFIPSYTAMHMHPTYHQQVYNEMQFPGSYNNSSFPSNVYSGPPGQNYSSYDPSASFTSATGYNAHNASMLNSMEGWQNSQSNMANGFYNFQTSQPYQTQPIQSQMSSQYHQPASPSAMTQSQNWITNQYQPPFMQNSGPLGGQNWQPFNASGAAQGPAQYHYGQHPAQQQSSTASFASQLPVPGGFQGNKSLFNPQTRSFVPGNTAARNGPRAKSKKGQPAASSIRSPGTGSHPISYLNDTSQTRIREDSLQQKYGTPATLPKKPPPSQVSPHFNNEHTVGSSNGPLIVNGNTKTSS